MPHWSKPGIEFAPEISKSVAKEWKHPEAKFISTPRQKRPEEKLMINEPIADSIFQQVVTRPKDDQVLPRQLNATNIPALPRR